MMRRGAGRFGRVVLAVALGSATAAGAQPAWRPDKPVEFVIPTAPGGNNDRLTRLAQKILQDRKIVTVPAVVSNRPGGNQHLSAVYTQQHAGDAHVVLFSNPTLFTNELNGISNQHYTALTPLALLVVESTVLTVRAGSPLKSMREVLDRLKADPESVSFGMPARGGQPHLTLAAAVRAGGADARKLKIVVFKGSGETLTAILGGHVDVMVSSAGSVLAPMQSGQARIIAISSAQRMTGNFAAAPTFREQGIDSTGITAWRGFFGPRGLSAQQIAYWDDALSKMTDTVEWKKNLEEGDLAQQYLRSGAFAKYLAAEYSATRAAMHDIGMLK